MLPLFITNRTYYYHSYITYVVAPNWLFAKNTENWAAMTYVHNNCAWKDEILPFGRTSNPNIVMHRVQVTLNIATQHLIPA